MLKLEIFETASTDDAESVFDARQAEKLRETAFEQGYAAGWQDALEHMRNEDALRRIASEEALHTISFSYNEAHAALQSSFLDLVQAMLDRVIPQTIPMALPMCLQAELTRLVAENTRLPVRISCAPAACAGLEQIVAGVPGLDIAIVPEPSFSDAQAALSVGAQERIIDLDFVLTRMREILSQNIERQQTSEISHG